MILLLTCKHDKVSGEQNDTKPIEITKRSHGTDPKCAQKIGDLIDGWKKVTARRVTYSSIHSDRNISV